MTMNIAKKILVILTALVCPLAFAQNAPEKKAGKETIAVTKIVATPALAKKVAANPKEAESLNLVSESLTDLLIAAFSRTRKFEIVTRNDLDAVMKEIDFSDSGNVDLTDKNAAVAGMLKGVKNIVCVKIYDFQDVIEEQRFATLNRTARARFALQSRGEHHRFVDGNA